MPQAIKAPQEPSRIAEVIEEIFRPVPRPIGRAMPPGWTYEPAPTGYGTGMEIPPSPIPSPLIPYPTEIRFPERKAIPDSEIGKEGKKAKREEGGIGEREPGKIYYKKTKQGMAYQDFKAPGFKEWTPKYKEQKAGGLSFYGPGFAGETTTYNGKTYTPEETWRNVLKTSDKTFKVGGVDVPESAYGLGETGALAGYLPPQAPRAPLTTQEGMRARINEITMEVMQWSRRNPANQPFAQQELEYRLRQENLMAPPAQTAFSPLTTQQRQAYEQLLRMPLWEGVTMSDIKNITGMGTEGEYMEALPPSPERKGGGTMTYTGKIYGGGGIPTGGGQTPTPPAGFTNIITAPNGMIGYENPQTGQTYYEE